MGSGKTTVGRALAETLDLPHRDSDADIEAEQGRTARAIAATDGVDRLHDLELAHLRDRLSEPGPSIVSAAASVIDDPAARRLLERPGVRVVWLRVDPTTAARRAATGRHRPNPEPLPEQAARRDPLFRAVADVTVDAALPVDHIVAQVLAATGHDSR